ncbi:MAG: DUF1822 family protein [Cyanobacteria bacterium J06598_3]
MNTQQSQQFHQMGITLPITTEHLRIAERFEQLCPFHEKSHQIRHNTLAVCAVNAYLQLMEIPTDLASSDSWKPMMQMMGNVADLKLPGLGALSCRTVSSTHDASCHVPPEAWQDRVGYVAIDINEANHQATLIGFTATVNEQEQVALTQFEPMETLIDHVHHLQENRQESPQASSQTSPQSAAVDALAAQASTALTQLGDWVNDAIATGWEAVDALINPNDLNFAFRTATTADLTTAGSTSNTAIDISRAKLIDLGLQLGQAVRVALVVHITQDTDDTTTILLQVRPLGESPYLAEGLSLTAFDESNNTLKSVTAEAIDNYIQFQLVKGLPGERFSVQIVLNEATFTEQFVI